MPFPGGAAPLREAQRRAAEGAGNVDGIARTSAVAPQRRSARRSAAHHDVASERLAMPQIATREWDVLAIGQLEQTAIEAIDPARVRPSRQRQREQTESRLAAHRRDIAQTARQRFPPDVLWPM